MKRELILHIGTSKTGSTAIQAAFARNRDALRAQGVLYPQSAGNTHHNLLAFAAMADHAKRDAMDSLIWNGMEPARRLAQFRADFEDELSASEDAPRAVISSEFLYMVLQTQGELRTLRDMLEPFFESIRVVIYLRRQDAHCASFYAQLLRAGNTRPPEETALHARPRHQLDYDEVVALWEDVFGEDDVTVRLYEARAGERLDVVQDFAGICGVALTAPDPGTARGSNTSMDLAGQTLLVTLGSMMKAMSGNADIAGPGWYTLTSSVTAACPGRGWQPSQDKARAFVSQYAAGNERLRERKFPERASLFSEDFSDLPAEASEPAPEALYDAALKTILELVRRLNLREMKQAADVLQRAKETGNLKRERLALTRLLRMQPADPTLRAALARLDSVENGAATARKSDAVERRRAERRRDWAPGNEA